MQRNWNDLPERSAKQKEHVKLDWKPLYTRILAAAVSLLLLLALESFLLRLMFAWY
jgi:hypothetical protein